MDPKDFYSPEPYQDVMKYASNRIEMEAFAIKSRGYGGMINIFSAPEDQTEQKHLLDKLTTELGIEKTDIVHINIEDIVNALELGIKRYQLEIPEEHFENQTLPENVFQFVYRFFGADGKGWRIGTFAMIDKIKELLEHDQTSLEGTPFADFLATLNLNFNDNNIPKMVVLHYPQLDTNKPIKTGDDADLAKLEEIDARRVEKFIDIYSLITQVYPGKFQHDNPQGNVVVNVLEDSYRWFAARNSRWINAYEQMTESVETPTSHTRNYQILNSGLQG